MSPAFTHFHLSPTLTICPLVATVPESGPLAEGAPFGAGIELDDGDMLCEPP